MLFLTTHTWGQKGNMNKIFCVIAITNAGPELHEFESEKQKLEWLATQSNLEDDFVAFEVEGTISGLESPHVGEDAQDVLDEMTESEAEMVQPKIVETPGPQWLVLPDEDDTRYTNWGDGREGDASALVAKVNADSALGLTHSDWRLPTIEELKSLVGTKSAPKGGWFWSSSQYVRGSRYSGWCVSFSDDYVGYNFSYYDFQVRLVRARQ